MFSKKKIVSRSLIIKALVNLHLSVRQCIKNLKRPNMIYDIKYGTLGHLALCLKKKNPKKPCFSELEINIKVLHIYWFEKKP